MFTNRTVLITGAAVGIGRAAAIRFAEQGANVVAMDVNADTLVQTETELRAITDRVAVYTCDICDQNAVETAVAESAQRFGGIDILVNNAALWRHFSPFTETSLDVWDTFFRINMFGTVTVTKAVVVHMINGGFGRIVNVASVAGVYGIASMAPYSATKGALIAFTKALAKELSPHGITVNAVSPGTVSPADERDITYTKETDMCYIGRTGSGKENADLICYLSSDSAAYISGQNIPIDGCRRRL